MATKAKALALLDKWAGASDTGPIKDTMGIKDYSLSRKQAESLWNLASAQSGVPLNTDSPLPR